MNSGSLFNFSKISQVEESNFGNEQQSSQTFSYPYEICSFPSFHGKCYINKNDFQPVSRLNSSINENNCVEYQSDDAVKVAHITVYQIFNGKDVMNSSKMDQIVKKEVFNQEQIQNQSNTNQIINNNVPFIPISNSVLHPISFSNNNAPFEPVSENNKFHSTIPHKRIENSSISIPQTTGTNTNVNTNTNAQNIQNLILQNPQCNINADAIQKNPVTAKFLSLNKTRRNGIPENARTAMRLWLLANRLYPYPTMEQKIGFSALYGITLKQITIFFINERSRLLKRKGCGSKGRNLTLIKKKNCDNNLLQHS